MRRRQLIKAQDQHVAVLEPNQGLISGVMHGERLC